jgi:hypothetical protein
MEGIFLKIYAAALAGARFISTDTLYDDKFYTKRSPNQSSNAFVSL